MTTFGYAERPAGVAGPTQRTPVNERLEPAPRAADGMRGLAVRGEGRRVRNRTHHNEAPARPAVPGGNAKSATGRLGAPSRPTMPAQGRRGDAAANSEPSAAETAVLPAVGAGDTAVLPAVPATAAPATGFPSRPDPSDPATEVWALVERAQAGEAEAFGLIYDRYVDTVFRFVYFRVGNRQLAEDLTSDTFLRALKRIGSFTWQGRDLGAWLVTIARNLVADHFKSGRYRLEVTTGDVLDADREDRGPEGSPEAAVVEHITNVALLTAVKQLNPEQQECIVLRFLQGFSVAETARAMGKNEGAIKALQYRAVRALARLLPDGFQP
ncbi:ECF subfamily RNA polymerase sigma factor, BldN family [Micromonospora sp. NPDC004551]|uniref:ECF subfamily RNA polymerase sigma factor, BldN family n=1 Tax=Micromonospora sp. NPDC004551 TaxID=3154284 RepID=UPI0033B304BC